MESELVCSEKEKKNKKKKKTGKAHDAWNNFVCYATTTLETHKNATT